MLTNRYVYHFSSRRESSNPKLYTRSRRNQSLRGSVVAILAIASGLFVSGCTFSAFAKTAPGITEESGPQIPPPYSRPIDDQRDAKPPSPRGDLTLSQAIRFAVDHNPELKAYAWDAQGSAARVRQASFWSNPELEFERENFGGTGTFSGSSLAETTLSLAQNLPLGGDIKHRRTLASLESQLADWDYHAARLELLVQVTRRFVAALAADRRLDLASQELELAQAVEKITKNRVDAGDASPVELTRVVVPVVTAELNLARARRNREASYRALPLSWGERVVTFEKVAGDLDAVSPVPNPQALIQYINDNPEVARWTTEISARTAERRLAKAEATPNLTAKFGLRRYKESGDEAFVFGLSLPIPLFDRSQGAIQAARMGEASAFSRKRAAELRIESMLNAAYAELANAQEEAIAMRDRGLPAAGKAYQATRLAFQEGKLPFLDVLDAQRTLFELQQRYLDALLSYHIQTAEIESLIGRPLSELTQ